MNTTRRLIEHCDDSFTNRLRLQIVCVNDSSYLLCLLFNGREDTVSKLGPDEKHAAHQFLSSFFFSEDEN